MINKFIIVLCLLCSGGQMILSAPAGWEADSIILEKDGYKPSLTSSHDKLFVSYIKKKNNNDHVFITISTDGGNHWLEEKKISLDFQCDNPRVIFHDRVLYVFWTQYREDQSDIYFSYSLDPSFSRFSPPYNITDNPSDSIEPVVSSSEETIHLLWSDDSSGDYEIFIKTFHPQEKTWRQPVQITRFSGGAIYPSVLTLMNDIHLSWQQRDGKNWKVMYSSSSDAEDWTGPVCISEGLDNAYTPYISTSVDGILVLFQGENDAQSDLFSCFYDLFYNRWSTPLPVTHDLFIQRYPVFIPSGAVQNLFWQGIENDQSTIFASTSSDSGLTWSEKINMIPGGDNTKYFSAFYNTFDDTIYLIWEDEKGQIRLKKQDKYCSKPSIFKSSHKEDQWSFRKDVEVHWNIDDDTSGIQDYAYLLDQNEDTVPDFFLIKHPVTQARFYNVKDGIWYFHLRARDKKGNISPAVHYKIMINSELYASSEKYYIIKYGDTLWDVAKSFYKEPTMYKTIADYNQIEDENWIYPHQILKIPPKEAVETLHR
ncbi:MAG: LysM peptidoglycan-binding domain-containing protein [Spirochaetes bacterium]|nr:LysM peptidoglycan-binding domain-containing protein [Spirochaetota bacterium]